MASQEDALRINVEKRLIINHLKLLKIKNTHKMMKPKIIKY